MEPVGEGTRVRYHGSLREYDGMEFTVTGTAPPRHFPELYDGGVAYRLTEVGGGFHGVELLNVRRSSFKPITDDK